MAAGSIRVRGVTYTNPDEAYVAADELEHRADELGAELRRDGKDAEAETVVDRGHADAGRLREWARSRSEAEAQATPQPADRPRSKPASRRRSSTSSRRSRRGASSTASSKPARRARAESTRSAPAAAGQAIYVRSGAAGAVRSWGALGWQLAGLTLGMVILTLFLTPRGVGAFTGLTGGAARALALIVDPIDPLQPRKQAAAAAAAMPGSYASALAAAATPARTRGYSPPLAGVHA